MMIKKIILDWLFEYFKEALFYKFRFELNSYLNLEDGYYPIRCTYLDEKIATFSDDMRSRGKIPYFRDLSEKKEV